MQVALISTPVEGNDRGRGGNEAVWWCGSGAGPWKMIGWGIDRRGFFSFFFSFFILWCIIYTSCWRRPSRVSHCPDRTASNADTALNWRAEAEERLHLVTAEKKKKQHEALLIGILFLCLETQASVISLSAEDCWIDVSTGGALQRPGHGEETTGCLRPEYDKQ